MGSDPKATVSGNGVRSQAAVSGNGVCPQAAVLGSEGLPPGGGFGQRGSDPKAAASGSGGLTLGDSFGQRGLTPGVCCVSRIKWYKYSFCEYLYLANSEKSPLIGIILHEGPQGCLSKIIHKYNRLLGGGLGQRGLTPGGGFGYRSLTPRQPGIG
jgi:hypothetical protein